MRFSFISVLILLVAIFSISQAIPRKRRSPRNITTLVQQNELNAEATNTNTITGDQNIVNQLGVATNINVSPIVSIPINWGNE